MLLPLLRRVLFVFLPDIMRAPEDGGKQGETGLSNKRCLLAWDVRLVFVPSPRMACPKCFAATRHNVKAWGIAPGKRQSRTGKP